MTVSLSLPFPEPWGVVLTSANHSDALKVMTDSATQLSPEFARALSAGLSELTGYLADLGIHAFASLFIPGDNSFSRVQAWCAVALLTDASTGPTALRNLVADSPFESLETDVTMMHRPDGHLARAASLRGEDRLPDENGHWPYLASYRYAFGIDRSTVALFHFETLSLAYLDELSEMFDAITTEAQVTHES
jgi:hypothetical protein